MTISDPPPSASRGLTPDAHDFARLLRARAELEDRARPYLTRVQAEVGAALERRGYEEVGVRQVLEAPAHDHVAADLTLVAVARLPGTGLRTPLLKAQLPLTVTYDEQFVARNVQVNRLTVAEPFVQPFSLEAAQVAEALVQFLSERYMAYLVNPS